MLRVADREPLGETESQRRKMAAILMAKGFQEDFPHPQAPRGGRGLLVPKAGEHP